MPHLGNIVSLAYIYCILYSMLESRGSVLDQDADYGPEYGSEWLLYVDEQGNTHTMNFSSVPPDQRGMMFGDAYFHLYTRRNQEAEMLSVPADGANISSVYFNASNQLKIVTHGWLSSQATEWLQKIKNSYLKKDDLNVILVDWSELADNPIYPWSAFATRYVGKRIAKLLSAIQRTYQLGGESVHLIGHSLGAQVMGYAGMFSDQLIYRITGLDPARPLFEIPPMGKNCRLERSDAAFVDIIHTCGGILGYRESHGHADFYPNEGRAVQPGCEGLREMRDSCSHGRACEYFDESILSDTPFVAYPCADERQFQRGECRENPTPMGEPADTGRFGDYYLSTQQDPPYSRSNE